MNDMDGKRALILAAHGYNENARNMGSCNAVYMGSMATATLMSRLGGEYGKDGLSELVAAANNQQLDAGLEICANIIGRAQLT